MAEVMANGNGVEVPQFGEAEDFAAPAEAVVEPSEVVDAAAVAEPEEEPETVQRNLYFVRIPKPVVDDSGVKKLQDKFADDIAHVKEFNSKLQAKRAELNDLRSKLREARSLKDGVSPEYGEKATMLDELRQKRNGYLREIKDIRSLSKGLDCRSEDELDTKINELESMIRGGEITIREERETVKQIARLNAQREKVREFEAQKDMLNQHEEELNFIKRCIDELESEFSVLRGEKVATDSIIKEWKVKLESKQAEMKELEELQQVAVDAKNRTLEELNKAREKMDEVMKEYRENRRFSAVLRDLVESGDVEQAREKVHEQVEEMMRKLQTDVKYRNAYFKLWESQRRFPVAEILPKSCANSATTTQPKGKGAAKPPPQPQGRKKAEAIIANLLESTKLELSERRQTYESEVSEPEPEVLPLPKPAAKPEPKPVATKSVDQSVFRHKVDLPSMENAYDADFVPPVVKESSPQLSEEELKAKIRQEQRAKAQEAEERKRRQQQKKAEAEEKKKRLQAEAKIRKQAEAAAAPEVKVEDTQPATDDSAVEASAGEEEIAAVEQPSSVTRRSRGVQQREPAIESRPTRRPKKEKTKVQKFLALIQEKSSDPVYIFLAVMLLTLLMVLLWFTTR